MIHTPAPWTVEHQRTRVLVTSPTAAIAHVSGVDDEAAAIAALIAAAPDLLAAAIVGREYLSIERNAFFDTSSREDGSMHPEDAEILADYDKALLQINGAILKAEGRA